MNKKRAELHVVRGPRGRKALSSPLRLEILGQFTNLGGLSVAELAERMGRPPASLYYHVKILQKAGILRQSGTRGDGSSRETIYEPVASRFELETGKGTAAKTDASKTVASALRMTQKDFDAALSGETTGASTEGAERNFYLSRVHARLSPRVLGRVNRHLQAIEDLLRREEERGGRPGPKDQFVSLTVALLPLRGRRAED